MTTQKRLLKQNIAVAVCLLGALFAVGMLFLILGDIFINAIPSLSLHFFLTPENKSGIGQGIANAVVGTILLSLFATALATPFAISTAIYLKRYAPDNHLTNGIRFMIEVMSGTPSIVVGMFGFLVLVIYFKPLTGGFSFIAGFVALAILIIPVIERAVECAIDTVGPELEDGSYALGATKWQTIHMVTIPAVMNGILTSLILGFGRAAEESSVIILTAGYSQFIPQIGISPNSKYLLGIQIHPFNDIVASLPYAVYNAYEESNVVPMSNAYAIAFILIVFVLMVNIAAKVVYSIASSQGKSKENPWYGCGFVTKWLRKKATDDVTVRIRADTASRAVPGVSSLTDGPRLSVQSEESRTNSFHETDTTMPAPRVPDPETPQKPPKKTYSLGAGINRLSHAIRQGIHIPVQKTKERQASGEAVTDNGTTDTTGSVSAGKPGNRGRLSGSLRPFLLTLIPFIIVAVILEILSFVLPGLSTFGSNGPAGTLAIPIMAIVLCAIGVVFSLFLVRGSTIFLLRHKKTKIGNRRAEYAAIMTGICLILIVAFLFSAHVFTPPEHPVGSAASTETVTSGSSQPPGGDGFFGFFDLIIVPGQNLLGFLHLSGLNATGMTGAAIPDASNRSAKLAALIASGAYGDTGASSVTPAPAPVSAASTPSAAQVTPVPKGTQPIVPVKYYLDVGESYWYGDDSRPCLATVYNVTTLSHYYWWDFNWNRFSEQIPASTGDTFIVVSLRIEDTGRMDALVPSADDFIVTNNGQTYTHNPFFDLSTLSQSQIDHYSAAPQSVPYQWIREIGQQKRDYAFLTGYNIFGQNTTVVTNYTVNSAASPPSASTGNGQGFFITPGSSNAIDGYLIYEVPDTVAADLKDTYVQISFNSISPTRWRLGK